MSFVLVSADCSHYRPEGRNRIYDRLIQEGWVKMNETTDVTSVWLGPVASGVSKEEAMSQARDKFYACFDPNCRPATVFHWSMTGPNVA